MNFRVAYGFAAPLQVEAGEFLAMLQRSSTGLPGAAVSAVEHIRWRSPAAARPSRATRLGILEVPIVRRPEELFIYAVEVEPIELFAFRVRPSPHCAEAVFGLARYPATVFDPHSGRRVATQLGSGWHWSAAFSAEEALAADGVLEFLSCHLWVEAILERAGELGCLPEVVDATGFWEQRDVLGLAWKIAEWTGASGDFEHVLQRALAQSHYMQQPGRMPVLALRIRELAGARPAHT